MSVNELQAPRPRLAVSGAERWEAEVRVRWAVVGLCQTVLWPFVWFEPTFHTSVVLDMCEWAKATGHNKQKEKEMVQ